MEESPRNVAIPENPQNSFDDKFKPKLQLKNFTLHCAVTILQVR